MVLTNQIFINVSKIIQQEIMDLCVEYFRKNMFLITLIGIIINRSRISFSNGCQKEKLFYSGYFEFLYYHIN
jgi:hypothetical protein